MIIFFYFSSFLVQIIQRSFSLDLFVFFSDSFTYYLSNLSIPISSHTHIRSHVSNHKTLNFLDIFSRRVLSIVDLMILYSPFLPLISCNFSCYISGAKTGINSKAVNHQMSKNVF